MTYLPFSNRFEKIFSESKELSSTWKVYEVEIRKVAGVISEYDRQIEAIKRACKKDGEIHPYCQGKLRVWPRITTVKKRFSHFFKVAYLLSPKLIAGR